jgi:antitoxin MazE
MKTKIVRIGNSRGVRIPRPLLEEAGLEDDVELRVVESGVMIERVSAPRTGWAEAAAELRERGDDRLLDEPVAAESDGSEWVW